MTTLKESLIQTTCAYCGVGCGVDVALTDNQPSLLEGMPEHPANYGRLCVKGTHLLDTISNDNRLTAPEINNKQVSWSEASHYVASEFGRIIAEHGPDAVAFYVSGQLLTEDYYIANKLMKGYIGSANIDTNSRLCMSSAVAGYKRAFGEDVVPCDYEDLEHTELLILIGSNAAWTHPVLYQRIARAKRMNPNMKVVVIDPRRTDSAELADRFLQIKPGTDAALYNGLLRYLADNQQLDNDFIEQHCDDFASALAAAQPWTIAAVARYCELDTHLLSQFYSEFANSASAISFYSMGINQSTSGVDKCNAIINAHLASGKLLKKGSGPFSITGQPNAMGGREVGGLANQLAAHLEINNVQHQSLVKRFWQSPTIATQEGAKALDMFDAIRDGKIKAVWIMGTNPMVSLPNTHEIAKALTACELVVVSDCVASNDTLEYAHVKLPSTGWGEKEGTVTNSERRISRQRAIIAPFAEAKNDWQILCDVAKKMGFNGFDFTQPSEIFDEWARLTSFENNGTRQLNLSALVGMSTREYNALRPIQWPCIANDSYQYGQVFSQNQFSTANKKARFIPITPQLPKQVTSTEYPLVMNSGRIRDQWHTMTRTGKSATLSSHITRPYIEIHPQDASQLGINNDDLVQAISKVGDVIANAKVTDSLRAGECFMPIHWNQQFASSANVGKLYATIADPISGQPETKFTAIKLLPVTFSQYMNVFVAKQCSCHANVTSHSDYWLKVNASNCSQYQLALNDAVPDILHWCQQISGIKGQWSGFYEGTTQRIQCIANGRLVFVAMISDTQVTTSIEWINHLFSEPALNFTQLQSLLTATPDEEFSQGRQICSCFKVREKPIIDAIKAGTHRVDELGQQLKCGTNCGSCKTELSQLIKRHALAKGQQIDVLITV
ncbi:MULTISPECIES: nitrate reductase [Pseudoalteromonas]|uniref:nitrate reductase n=1 Tax=Pseudoalteromonas TaxID=53246 RepID=UPI0002D725F3|nr:MULTISPECIES: nitrate reductase [Pseudoalteromonas]